MQTKEELNALKEEVETLNKKLAELTEDELKEVTGGFIGYTDGFTVDEGAESIIGSSGFEPEGDWIQGPPCVSK